ncbi:MAG: hypothetical protein V2A54_05350 [Bacteroidota bacterium]
MKKAFILSAFVSLAFLTIYSCKDKESEPVVPEGTYRFQGIVNNIEKDLINKTNGYEIIYTGTGCETGTGTWSTAASGLSQESANFNIASHEAILVIFRNWYNPGSYNSDSLFHAIFNLNSVTYYQMINGQDTNSVKGIEVRWTDGMGEVWSSKYGGQSGASFSITESKQKVGSNGEDAQEIYATFNCTVYKVTDPSKSIVLSACTIRTDFHRACY